MSTETDRIVLFFLQLLCTRIVDMQSVNPSVRRNSAYRSHHYLSSSNHTNIHSNAGYHHVKPRLSNSHALQKNPSFTCCQFILVHARFRKCSKRPRTKLRLFIIRSVDPYRSRSCRPQASCQVARHSSSVAAAVVAAIVPVAPVKPSTSVAGTCCSCFACSPCSACSAYSASAPAVPCCPVAGFAALVQASSFRSSGRCPGPASGSVVSSVSQTVAIVAECRAASFPHSAPSGAGRTSGASSRTAAAVDCSPLRSSALDSSAAQGVGSASGLADAETVTVREPSPGPSKPHSAKLHSTLARGTVDPWIALERLGDWRACSPCWPCCSSSLAVAAGILASDLSRQTVSRGSAGFVACPQQPSAPVVAA